MIKIKQKINTQFYKDYKIKKHNPCNITIICLVALVSIFSVIAPLKNFAAAPSNAVELGKDLTENVANTLEQIDFSALDELVAEFNKQNTNIFSITNVKNKIFSIISGEDAVNYKTFIASVLSLLIEGVIKYLPLLSIIVAIGVICNLLGGVKSKFNEKSTGDLIHLVCFFAVVILTIGMINSLAGSVQNSIDGMTNQMNIIFPILLTLMTALGAHASVGVYQPIVAIISTYAADFFRFLILPMFMISFVFAIISNMSGNIKLDKFNAFISSLFKWAVGAVFTIFFAIFTIQGISAGSFDSVSMRTTKYTIKSYVPLIGGYISDGMDIIMASTVLIKNAVGLTGMLLIFGNIISPLIEIVVFSLLLKLVSAILQPLGNDRTSNFCSATSKAITMLSTCLIAIGFMYIISVGLIMTTSNMVVL